MDEVTNSPGDGGDLLVSPNSQGGQPDTAAPSAFESEDQTALQMDTQPEYQPEAETLHETEPTSEGTVTGEDTAEGIHHGFSAYTTPEYSSQDSPPAQPEPSVASSPPVIAEPAADSVIPQAAEAVQPFTPPTVEELPNAPLESEPPPETVQQQPEAVTGYNLSASGNPLPVSSIYRPPNAFSGFIKFLLILLIPLVGVAAAVVFVIQGKFEFDYRKENDVLMVAPMKDVNWEGIGEVFEPLITIPIKTPNGFENWEFLIDSGATISSLPREWVDKLGLDLAFMKRSTFKGFGGKTSFAYQGEVTIRLSDEEILLPVVFTEATGTKSLLGRKGFFEDYSIYFNHLEKRIEIRK